MKKYAPYILILIILVGLFSPKTEVQAQVGNCALAGGLNARTTQIDCEKINPVTGQPFGTWTSGLAPAIPSPTTGSCVNGRDINGNPCTPASPAGETDFQRIIRDNTCGLGWATLGGSIQGCIVQIAYVIFYTIPAYLLWASAQFFNVLIFITLGSQLLKGSSFIVAGWEIVRDLSNIFFILILLYIAVKLILGLGGSEVKKMIAQVVIMALLINFSMFMTGVVIDTSNILALIFYNKLSVTTVRNGQTVPIDYTPKLATEFGVDKDVAGAMTAAFDPTSLLDKKFFEKAGEQCVPAAPCVRGPISPGILIGITIIAGALMFFAAYAFFVAGISFVGRLIELWVLIIFSPFAFMSFTLPILAHVDYIGWDAWFKRLFKVSFMAPIFMFFMYFIFLLLHNGNPFGNVITPNGGVINTILLVVIPAIVILVLLLKATEFAKKGGGKLGEFASATGKIIGGLTVGAVTGGAALALSAGIGGGGGFLANKAASGMNKLATKKFLGIPLSALGTNKMASGLTSVGKFAQKSSFDIRGIKIGGQTLASTTGIPMGEAQKGGVAQRREDKVKKRRERAETLKVREDEKISQKINKAEMDLQVMLNEVAGEFDKIDKDLVDLRQKKQDATTEADKNAITTLIKAKVKEKTDLKDGTSALAPRVKSGANTGKTIKDLESSSSGLIPQLKREREAESRRRTVAFANRKGGWGILSSTANKEARHKIIMESKIESKGEDH